MATAANPTNNHSPRNSGETGSLNGSQSRRSALGVSYPWTQIVRGTESEPITPSTSSAAAAEVVAASFSSSHSHSSSGFLEQVTQSSSSDLTASNVASSSSSSSSPSPEDSAMEAQQDSSDYGGGNNNAGKKPAWNKPSNGVVEVGPVMGAVTWPALSESTRASPKSLSSESLKASVSDGSSSAQQGTGIASSSQKQKITDNPNPISTPNHVAPPTRQKSLRRGGGSSSGSVSANGGFPESQPPTLGSVAETPSNNAGKSGSVVPESSARDHTQKETGHKGNFGSQSHSGNDHTQQRSSFRRGSGGPHPRGDGSYHHNYGGRHDQDRGNHDWNRNRSFNGREAHMHPPRGVPRGYIPPAPHSSTQFMPPQMPVRPFGGPMVYPEVPASLIYVPGPPPESLRAVPISMPPPPMYFPVPDPQLHSKIVNQIDYYFSTDNLIKDDYLRKQMDGQGWVPIKLIAGFKKVKQLTDNVQLILDAVRTSTVVEVQSDKVRKRDDWMRWIMSPVPFTGVSSPQSFGRSSPDMLASSIQNVSLAEKIEHEHAAAFLNRSSSGDLSGQSQPSTSGEGTSQVTFQAGSERSFPGRS